MDARRPAPLTGRSRETAQLGGCFTRLEAGRGTLLLVAADAGAGKSRLAAEAVAMAAARGVPAGWGRSRVDGATATLVPWAVALGAAGVADLFALAEGAGDAPEGDLPGRDVPDAPGGDASDASNAPEGADGADRGRLVDQLLERLRRAGPAALILDDLDEADDATLGLLGQVAGRLADLPLVVVATFRPASAVRRAALGRLLRQVADEPCCDLLELEPLAVDDTIECAEALAERRLAPDRVIAVVARCGGNPFLIGELVRATAGGVDPALPRTARELLSARLDVLDPLTRRVLEALAVLGGEAPAEALAPLVGSAPVALDGAFATVEATGLVERSDAAEPLRARREEPVAPPAPTWRLAHPLIWDAVMAGLSPEVARELHRRALDGPAPGVVADPGARAEARAHHAIGTGLVVAEGAHPADRPHPGDGLALVLEAARWCRRRGAPENAVSLLARAREATEDHALVAELEVARGEALLAAGAVGAARDAFEEALRSARGDAGVATRARRGILACVAATHDLEGT